MHVKTICNNSNISTKLKERTVRLLTLKYFNFSSYMLKVEKPFQAFHKLTGKVYYFGDTLQYSVHHVFVLKVQTFENQTKQFIHSA